jgi:hypothetical protein
LLIFRKSGEKEEKENKLKTGILAFKIFLTTKNRAGLTKQSYSSPEKTPG